MENQCDVIKDLLPLQIDGLTSKASNAFIAEHLQACPNCLGHLQGLQADLQSAKLPVSHTLDESVETKALKRLRNRIYVSKITLLALGGIFGAYATGRSPFQAPLLVYPLVGIAGELLLGNVYMTPLVVFGGSVIGMFVFEDVHFGYIIISAVYSVFTLMGAGLSYSIRKVFER